MPAKVTVNLRNLERLKKQAKKYKHVELRVGVEAGATEASGVPVSTIAAYLEYGWVQSVTAKQAGWLGAHGVHMPIGATLVLPPRPTFHSTAEANKSKWVKTFNFAMKSLARNPDAAIQRGLIMVGEQAQGDVQDTIQSNGAGRFALRSPITQLLLAGASKGHKTDGTGNAQAAKALTNTGTFLHSIVYEIKGL